MTEPAHAGNLLIDFYDQLPAVIAHCVADPRPVEEPGSFTPGFALPEMDDALLRYFAVAGARWQPLGEYGGHPVTLLDLTGNPGTHTTKTLASLLIVARAVAHIRRTGRPLLIVSPTSANKGVALRDAVLRAIDAGLVGPEQLRVAVVAPHGSRQKLRASRLSTDAALHGLNPVLVSTAKEPEAVKALARDFVREHAPRLRARYGLDTWFSLDLANYLIADAARALFEHRVSTVPDDRPRWHAHAVSSAFGLLGYHAGRALLERQGAASPQTRPASLLVQHLATPDMVLALRYGPAAEDWRMPAYPLDPATGLYRRVGDDPHFPTVTYDPSEVLDPTFYTHRPATSPAMNEIIRTHGGDGIVVSLAECVARYPYLRSWLGAALPTLPADLRTLREWSTVMALTGVANAVDRDLIPAGPEIVVHGTGCYSDADFEPLCGDALTEVSTVDDIAEAVG